MAIDIHQFRMICESEAKGKALSAGYPDLLVRWEDIPGHEQLTPTPRPDTDAVQAHHGWQWPIYDTGEVFSWMGLKLEVIDRQAHQGTERCVDLNLEQLWEYEHENDMLYDLVIDPGTTEHCFNIAQAAINLASAVKQGGYISQAIPMSMFNHGYFNVNPKFFIDFYEQNGFDIKQLVIRSGEDIFPLVRDDARKRLMGVPENSVIICLAQRTTVQPFVFPIDQ